MIRNCLKILSSILNKKKVDYWSVNDNLIKHKGETKMTKKEIQIIKEETQRKKKLAAIFEKDTDPKYKKMYDGYISEYCALKMLMSRLNIK